MNNWISTLGFKDKILEDFIKAQSNFDIVNNEGLYLSRAIHSNMIESIYLCTKKYEKCNLFKDLKLTCFSII